MDSYYAIYEKILDKNTEMEPLDLLKVNVDKKWIVEDIDIRKLLDEYEQNRDRFM